MIDDEPSQSAMHNAVKIKFRNNLSTIITSNFVVLLILTHILFYVAEKK